jgi:hypothetical protein
MSDIPSNLLHSCAKSRERIRNSEIDLPGVRLGGDAVALGEPGFLAQQLVELVLHLISTTHSLRISNVQLAISEDEPGLTIFAPSPLKISMNEA